MGARNTIHEVTFMPKPLVNPEPKEVTYYTLSVGPEYMTGTSPAGHYLTEPGLESPTQFESLPDALFALGKWAQAFPRAVPTLSGRILIEKVTSKNGEVLQREEV